MPTMYSEHLSRPPQISCLQRRLLGPHKRGVVSGGGALGCWLSSAGLQDLGKSGGLLGLVSEKTEKQFCLAGTVWAVGSQCT